MEKIDNFVSMKYIFLIAAFNAFLFSLLLLQKKNRALHDNILICWLVYLGLYITVYTFYSHELFTRFRLLSISLLSLLMLHGPFLYFYIQTLVSSKKRLLRTDLLHFLPFLLFNIYILLSSFTEISGKLNIEKLGRGNDPPILFLFFLILTAFSGSIYFLLTIRLFRRLDIRIFNNYSFSADIDLKWLRWLVLVFGIVWTLLICVTVIHHIFKLFSMIFCTDGLFLSLSAFVILSGYFGLKQKVIFPSGEQSLPEDGNKAPVKYAGSRLTDQESKSIAERLTVEMSASRPYLNPDLTLSQLAASMRISSHFLSQVINENFNLNFFDFVNRYRVEEFKVRLANPANKNFSLLGIAFDCGFNSKSAFNRIFKQLTGLTPSQYRNGRQTLLSGNRILPES